MATPRIMLSRDTNPVKNDVIPEGESDNHRVAKCRIKRKSIKNPKPFFAPRISALLSVMLLPMANTR